MKLLKKLDNPFVLGLHGFVLGAALFFTASAIDHDSAPPAETAAASAYQLPDA